jgi:hypothetical protein
VIKIPKINFKNADKKLFLDIRKSMKMEKNCLKSFGERFTDGFPFWCIFDQVFSKKSSIWNLEDCD